MNGSERVVHWAMDWITAAAVIVVSIGVALRICAFIYGRVRHAFRQEVGK